MDVCVRCALETYIGTHTDWARFKNHERAIISIYIYLKLNKKEEKNTKMPNVAAKSMRKHGTRLD